MKIVSIDPGQKNFAWVFIEMPGLKTIDYGTQDVNVVSAASLVGCLSEDFMTSLKEADQVIIERQTFKNFMMSKLSFYMEMYCHLYGTSTCLVGAQDKLGVFKERGIITSKDTKNHYQRKQQSIRLVELMISSRCLTGIDVRCNKKQDDLCDCILQAVGYYIRVHPGSMESFFLGLVHNGTTTQESVQTSKSKRKGASRLTCSLTIPCCKEDCSGVSGGDHSDSHT
jgi:hypothetical protein